METLVNLRRNEKIIVLDDLCVDDKSKIAYVTVELQNRNEAILVFANHSDDIVDVILKEINPTDSGYVFFASELKINPVNSTMVPTHRLATTSEVNSLEDRRIPINKLPILRMLDPIRRWHNFPEKSIVAIERNKGCVYFRIVL